MLKKVTLGLIALGVSASALAAGPGADVPIPAAPASINVTAPVQHGSWEIGLEAGYYEVGNSNFQYAQTQENSGSTTDAIFKNHDVEPSHDWMGHADVTFNIPGNGRYVSLGFSHFRADDSDSTRADGTSGGRSIVGTPFNNSVFNGSPVGNSVNNINADYNYVKGSTENNYNDVDLVFGQKIDVGHRVRMKFFGGLRYASIDTRSKATATASTTSSSETTDISDSGKIKSDFYGFGPRAGIDSQVNLGYGFSLIGRIAGSLLIGEVDNKVSASRTTTNTSSVGGATSSTNSATLKDTSDTRIIPEADARIGLHYNYGFNPSTSLGLEVGYQVENYFNVVDKDTIDAVVPNSANNNNDWGFHGPYLRAQINLA